MPKKHKQHDEEHMDETWLIPYADLLTLLLALFIVLFASSNIDIKKYDQLIISLNSAFNSGSGMLEFTSAFPRDQDKATDSTKEVEEKDPDEAKAVTESQLMDLEKLKKELDRYIANRGLQSEVETNLNRNQLMITIRDHALFDSGSAEVKESARELGVAISEILVNYPDYEIVVSGHTDNRPIHTAEFESNWDLSTKRAVNFMKIFLENPDQNPGRFHAAGYGEYRPIDTNETAEGRAKNRRVEISIFKYTDAVDTGNEPQPSYQIRTDSGS